MNIYELSSSSFIITLLLLLLLICCITNETGDQPILCILESWRLEPIFLSGIMYANLNIFDIRYISKSMCNYLFIECILNSDEIIHCYKSSAIGILQKYAAKLFSLF